MIADLSFRFWSYEKPTTCGLYWITSEDFESVIPVLVTILDGVFSIVICSENEQRVWTVEEAANNIQWCGPIVPTLMNVMIDDGGNYLKMEIVQ